MRVVGFCLVQGKSTARGTLGTLLGIPQLLRLKGLPQYWKALHHCLLSTLLHPGSPTAIFFSSLSAWVNSMDAWFTSLLPTWMASISGPVPSTSGHTSLVRTVRGLWYQHSLPWDPGRRSVEHFKLKRWRPNKNGIGHCFIRNLTLKFLCLYWKLLLPFAETTL